MQTRLTISTRSVPGKQDSQTSSKVTGPFVLGDRSPVFTGVEMESLSDSSFSFVEDQRKRGCNKCAQFCHSKRKMSRVADELWGVVPEVCYVFS